MTGFIPQELEKLFPTDPEYDQKRRWIAQQIAKDNTDSDRSLINFHYTAGGPPWPSKEAILAEIRKGLEECQKKQTFGKK